MMCGRKGIYHFIITRKSKGKLFWILRTMFLSICFVLCVIFNYMSMLAGVCEYDLSKPKCLSMEV